MRRHAPGAPTARAVRSDHRASHRAALRRTIATARPHLAGHRLLALLGVFALLADVAFRVLEPWPVKFVVDAVTASLGADIATTTSIPPVTAQLLIMWALILVALVAGRAVASYASTVAFAFVGSRVATALRSRVFHHVQGLSLRYHSTASTGDTVQRLVGDVGRLQEVAVTAGLPLVGNALTLIVLSVVMVLLDPLLAVVVLLAAVAYAVTSRRTTPSITQASRQTRKGEGTLAGTAAETLSAIRVVQSYGLERTVASQFDRGNDVALKDGVKARRLAAALERSTDMIVGVATALVLGGGAWRVVEGAMTPGDLVLFLMYLKIAMKPLRDTAKYTGRIARAVASGERIADLLDTDAEVRDAPSARPLPRVRGDVTLQRVCAVDGRGRPLFRGVDLHVPAGQQIGVLGPSGVGKSTLVSFLLRLADPAEGRVLLDGHDVTQATLSSVRSQVSILLQDSVLFAATVADNIRYGRLGATDADVLQAARQSGAHEFIAQLPQGYFTVLGARGDTLSGGQRQRIAIARAMLRDAPLVILDEAVAGLDPAAKHLVETSLRRLTQSRTTFVITHDPQAVRGLDRVIWLEEGRIVEDGNPAVLMTDPTSRVANWIAWSEAAPVAPAAPTGQARR